VYAGTLELGPNGSARRLGAGDSTTFAGDVPHDYYALPGADVAATLVVRYVDLRHHDRHAPAAAGSSSGARADR
jgi:quercetin dioxygenase-like cupin family protein